MVPKRSLREVRAKIASEVPYSSLKMPLRASQRLPKGSQTRPKTAPKTIQKRIKNHINFEFDFGHLRAFYAPGGHPLRSLITAAGARMQFRRNWNRFDVTLGASWGPFGAQCSPFNSVREAKLTENTSELSALERIWARSEFRTELSQSQIFILN